MSKLIVYFSLSGNNRKMATELAEKEKEKEKADIKEFASGGNLRVFQFFAKKRLARQAKKIDLSKYDEVVLFGPIWWGKPAPALMALLQNLEIDGKNIECNITQTTENEGIESLVRKTIEERNGIVKNITITTVEEKTK